MPEDLSAGVGSLVQVPFHGRLVRGWVLGSTEDVPTRTLRVKRRVSPLRFFDEPGLELLWWVAERYVAPLAAVIARSHPPRVASEEEEFHPAAAVGTTPSAGASDIADRASLLPLASLAPERPLRSAAPAGQLRRDRATAPAGGPLSGYRGGRELVEIVRQGAGAFVVRPAPEDEVDVAVQLVAECLSGGRRALVLVPEADPVPATASALLEMFGARACLFLGGDRRRRFRTWIDVRSGLFDVVIGTRPSVLASIAALGLVFVSRESHAGHREDRAPYYHVRDVALARARIQGGACVLSALCPSSEAAALRLPWVSPIGRRWPPVEVVRPGPEGRAPRLLRALREARRGFLLAPLPGAGVARVCRRCREPAACDRCGGLLREEEGRVRCVVCEADGRCRNCGSTDFGVEPGGRERVEVWARRISSVPVRRVGSRPRLPEADEVLVGGLEAVRDLGVGGLDLVGILDADRARRRPGITSRERALASWFEAAGWARPNGRVIVQTSFANDVAVQALVRGNPSSFHGDEARRRDAAGFPVGSAVFRVAGHPPLREKLDAFEPFSLLESGTDAGITCLVALDQVRVPVFGHAMRDLASRGVVTRVEAEPHL